MKMLKLVGLWCLLISSITGRAQEAGTPQTDKALKVGGLYLQWGYNNAWYTRSNIHFRLSNGDRFTIHKAKGEQRGSFDALLRKPWEITIPQYNYRIGVYLNKARTRAVEINFDHTKYVLSPGQSVPTTGVIAGNEVNEDKIIDGDQFLAFEHTDGANWFHLNYVYLGKLLEGTSKQREILGYVWKVGAGINVPRSDFTYMGERLNNKFHIAGFNVGAEGGFRVYPFKSVFLELTGKTGYVNYLNALINTEQMKGNRANHHFEYVEVIGTIGVDIAW